MNHHGAMRRIGRLGPGVLALPSIAQDIVASEVARQRRVLVGSKAVVIGCRHQVAINRDGDGGRGRVAIGIGDGVGVNIGQCLTVGQCNHGWVGCVQHVAVAAIRIERERAIVTCNTCPAHAANSRGAGVIACLEPCYRPSTRRAIGADGVVREGIACCRDCVTLEDAACVIVCCGGVIHDQDGQRAADRDGRCAGVCHLQRNVVLHLRAWGTGMVLPRLQGVGVANGGLGGRAGAACHHGDAGDAQLALARVNCRGRRPC